VNHDFAAGKKFAPILTAILDDNGLVSRFAVGYLALPVLKENIYM